jgi:alkylation response protein AidB-like acyl-CoA dehydrogenase
VGAAIAHVRTRTQFGRPVGAFQAVSFPLAAALARIRAVRLLYQHAAWVADQGADTEQLAAQALATAAELAVSGTAQAVQAHGAVALTEESTVQRHYRRAHAAAAWLGTAGWLAELAAVGIAKGGAHRFGQVDRA